MYVVLFICLLSRRWLSTFEHIPYLHLQYTLTLCMCPCQLIATFLQKYDMNSIHIIRISSGVLCKLQYKKADFGNHDALCHNQQTLRCVQS